MHSTPVERTTLLHLAIEFNEPEIVEWLLQRGANVDAAAELDAQGFGGHTPIFDALLCGPVRDTERDSM